MDTDNKEFSKPRFLVHGMKVEFPKPNLIRVHLRSSVVPIPYTSSQQALGENLYLGEG